MNGYQFRIVFASLNRRLGDRPYALTAPTLSHLSASFFSKKYIDIQRNTLHEVRSQLLQLVPEGRDTLDMQIHSHITASTVECVDDYSNVAVSLKLARGFSVPR